MPHTLSLVCFPHAGGGLTRFRRWRDQLPAGVELLLPELPGREGRLFDEPFADVASLSECAMRQLAAEIERSDEVAVAGISYGALVAFDLATRLEAAGKRVHAVFAASQRAPSTRLPAVNWRSMADQQLLAELVSIGGLSPELVGEEEFLELFLPVIRAELHASETYLKPADQNPLQCPVFLYHGVEDAAIPAASAHAWRDETEHFSWRSLNAAHFLTGPYDTDLWFEALRKDLRVLATDPA